MFVAAILAEDDAGYSGVAAKIKGELTMKTAPQSEALSHRQTRQDSGAVISYRLQSLEE
jgi:hypothetical protein